MSSQAQPPRPPASHRGVEQTNGSAVLELAIPPAALEALALRVAELVTARVADSTAPAPADGWLDVNAAADYLACKPKRIYDLVGQSRLRCMKDGTRSLFRREWLDAALEDPR